ncbi:MAG TPA: protein kinase [Blastocatellia bacterium]|nr:protein kinase [Blastocatellia bacterium]
MASIVGNSVLHYRILKEIGKGGMGVVYKAEDTKLHRTVAIKALSTDLLTDEKARARFLREARAASAIDHPNICAVYETNETEDLLFFVMQYIDGKTLKKTINGRPLSIEQGLELSLQLGSALAEAHRRHVIHRDIKSSNIMVDERGHARILDFGLAKLVNPDQDGAEVFGKQDLTKAGTPFGTASYMSPEQARGEQADHRTDIFSFGVVMYEMAAGRLPFKGKTSVDVMHEVLHSEPIQLDPSIPEAWRRVIGKALTKDPAGRYQTADALLEDLRSVVKEYYADQRTTPANMSASLAAVNTAEKAGLIGKMTSWVKGVFGGRSASGEETSAAKSATADLTPSMWHTRDKKAIAILPFKNLSGSPEAEFYSFSLADSVITELAQLRDLIVRPSSYIARYQNKDVDPRDIGTTLAVDAVLAGGYIKSGDRFRVTPQLVDTKSGEIIWSEKIDVDARDIITIQDTITRQIVEGLRVKTSSGEEAHMMKAPTENADAYDLCLQARATLHRFTQTLVVEDLEAAIALFKQATELDPEFARAFSGLGVCYVNYVLKGIGGVEYYKLAKNAFEKALTLDRRLIEPRVRLVYIDLAEGAAVPARREVRRLLTLAPNEPTVHAAAAYVFRLSGKYAQALQEWDKFLKVNPGDLVFASYNRARIYMYQRDYAGARAELEKGFEVEPEHPLLRTYDAVITFLDGDAATAAKQLEEVLEKTPDIHSYSIFLAFCYYALGRHERAFELIDEKVLASARADQDIAYWVATLYAMSARADLALEWLELAISMGNENYPWFAVNPMWDPIKDDPRYVAILEMLRSGYEKSLGK